MTDRELMQQALEAMLAFPDDISDEMFEAIRALKERLAQPEMEPCAGRNCGSTNPNLHSAECFEDYEKSTGMNQWHGLTDEELEEMHNEIKVRLMGTYRIEDICRSIEAKLKEKNHG